MVQAFCPFSSKPIALRSSLQLQCNAPQAAYRLTSFQLSLTVQSLRLYSVKLDRYNTNTMRSEKSQVASFFYILMCPSVEEPK
uniref:Uncharacterized protein n=1 Tax=Anopheles minimus TaxID=112268 RepID=A0A182WQG1_9DIPT